MYVALSKKRNGLAMYSDIIVYHVTIVSIFV